MNSTRNSFPGKLALLGLLLTPNIIRFGASKPLPGWGFPPSGPPKYGNQGASR